MNHNFPPELDCNIYRSLHKDLRKFSDKELQQHFDFHGKKEGRISNNIHSRHDFLQLIPQTASTLEIGPFYSPIVKGSNVKYFDVLSSSELRDRAIALGYDATNIPHIDFVDPQGNLKIIEEKFDVVVSSHSIEHQPDVVAHINNVERLLAPSGLYFILIPDKRYVFDHFIPETSLADVITKHLDGVTAHSLKSVIEHRALTTHNDPARHWAGDHGAPYENFTQRAQAAIEEYKNANGSYIDVHASYFTPDNFVGIFKHLLEMGMINMKMLRAYHTRRGQNEFFVIMQKI